MGKDDLGWRRFEWILNEEFVNFFLMFFKWYKFWCIVVFFVWDLILVVYWMCLNFVYIMLKL